MITSKVRDNLSVTITSGKHAIIADVSNALGGDDAGPGPHDLLEASLGACTTITVMMFARRKQWPLKDVVTTVTILSEKGEINEIQRDVQLIGDLSEEQRTRLLEIANKCPMHNFLQKKSQITTRIV